MATPDRILLVCENQNNPSGVQAPLSMVSVSVAFVALDKSPRDFENERRLWTGWWSNEPKPPGDSPLSDCIQK